MDCFSPGLDHFHPTRGKFFDFPSVGRGAPALARHEEMVNADALAEWCLADRPVSGRDRSLSGPGCGRDLRGRVGRAARAHEAVAGAKSRAEPGRAHALVHAGKPQADFGELDSGLVEVDAVGLINREVSL